MPLFNVSISCNGLSSAHVSGCSLIWLPKAIWYCISHAWDYCSYKFSYTPKFLECLKTLKIERVKEQ